MLNAFYAGINAVNPAALVITGGTAPYGDPGRRGPRMQPGSLLGGSRAWKRPVSFDVAALNPINVGGPTRRALNRDDISTPDVGKLRRILRQGGGTKSSPAGRPIWATEIWWDSRPPDPGGVRLRSRRAGWRSPSTCSGASGCAR